MYGMKKAAKTAIDVCTHVAPGESIYIATDREQSPIAYAFEKEARMAAGRRGSVEVQLLDDYFSKSFLNGRNALREVELPEQMERGIDDSNVSFYISTGREPITLPNKVIERATKGKRRHVQMAGVSADAIIEGLSPDYKEIKKFTDGMYDIASTAREINITSDEGTNVKAKFDPRYKWVKDSGIAEEVDYIELPDGELFTTPIDVSGTVYTNLLGDNFDVRYGRLKAPMSFNIKNSRLVPGSVKCKGNEGLKKEFLEYIDEYEDGNRVGEFSLPTNIGLMRKGVKPKNEDVLLLVEKTKPHMAFGAPPDDRIKADWNTLDALENHVDFVLPNSNVSIDGRPVMKKGQYTI